MATVSVTSCAGGGHLTVTIDTAKGSVVRHIDTTDLMRESESAEDTADLIMTNLRIRAVKAGARNAQAIKAQLEAATFAEI
jgi:hypothetical protein